MTSRERVNAALDFSGPDRIPRDLWGERGPYPDKGGRKSQLMLFGTANNCLDASGFGVGELDNTPAP